MSLTWTRVVGVSPWSQSLGYTQEGAHQRAPMGVFTSGVLLGSPQTVSKFILLMFFTDTRHKVQIHTKDTKRVQSE